MLFALTQASERLLLRLRLDRIFMLLSSSSLNSFSSIEGVGLLSLLILVYISMLYLVPS